MVDRMDVETLRACAQIAKGRADRAKTDQSALGDRRDGLERLGAARALDQLAADLEATARAFESGEEIPMDDASDTQALSDRELLEAYERTDGNPESPEVARLIREIERRGLDV